MCDERATKCQNGTIMAGLVHETAYQYSINIKYKYELCPLQSSTNYSNSVSYMSFSLQCSTVVILVHVQFNTVNSDLECGSSISSRLTTNNSDSSITIKAIICP